jgi:PAS domain S-box-containing protein
MGKQNMSLLNRLFYVPTKDPEDARRRSLLTILLVGIAALMLAMVLVTVVASIMGLAEQGHVTTLVRGSLFGLAGLIIIYLINRYWSGWIASSLLLLLLILITAFSDDPQQLVDGRTLFVFAIPILMSSVLLRPYASFFLAGFVSILLILIAAAEQIVPNLIATIGFFAIAFVSWLSARSLQNALADLRRVNLELDRRVDERTKDLTEALAREHAEWSKNQAILEGIADGVIVFDVEGKAIVANPAIGRILSMPSDAIVGRDIRSLMGKEVAEDDQAMIISLLAEQELRRLSVKFEWGDKTLSVSFASLGSTLDHVTGTVAVFRDFTHEAQIDRMRSDFVSIVSHELRTPLTSIKGYLDLVLMGAAGTISAQQESFLQIAKSNADRLHVLVSDLLDLSRIESGRVELDIQVVSLPAVIDQVVSSLQKEFDDRDLTLVVDVPVDLPEIFGDPGRISQILMNLLSNAYKYTQEGGATLRARLVRDALQIDVIDTGVGISVEDREKLFTPFFRAEDSIVRQQTGTGLGLSITELLIARHGGKIWVESEPGVGSKFSFTLPLPAGLVDEASLQEVDLEAPTRLRKARQPAASAVSLNYQIMVADDEADVAHLFRHQLERAGYGVTVVTQGSQVVEVARRLRPDLITLDLLMDVDGLSVLKELKAEPSTANIPVVIISVISEPDKGLALGAADYLVKPMDEGELIECIRRVLNHPDDGTRTKILVVDDEIDIVGWLKHFLTHSGYLVMEAYDGVQALEAVAADKPDLVLLDMKMPRMDGRTTIRRLREQEETRNIPVIVLSANPVSNEAERAQLLDMGVKEFLRKPVTMDHLIAEIRRHLGGQ